MNRYVTLSACFELISQPKYIHDSFKETICSHITGRLINVNCDDKI